MGEDNVVETELKPAGPEVEAELRELICRWLPEYGYHPTAAACERMAQYLGLVIGFNDQVRLVGEAGTERLVRRHLGESLLLGTRCDLEAMAQAGAGVVDVGSGGGFPGLALGLGWPGLKTTLVEATAKKARFLTAAAAGLGLSEQLQVRAEFLPRRPRASEPAFSGLVTVRALEHMEKVPSWMGHWLGPGARAAFWVSDAVLERWQRQYPGWQWEPPVRIPASEQRVILLGRPG